MWTVTSRPAAPTFVWSGAIAGAAASRAMCAPISAPAVGNWTAAVLRLFCKLFVGWADARATSAAVEGVAGAVIDAGPSLDGVA